MSSILNRALIILRSLSFRTHAFTMCVIAGTLLLCMGFFKEPNTDVSHITTNVTKEMQTASASNLTIDIDVVSLSINSDSDEENVIEVNEVSIDDVKPNVSVRSLSIESYRDFAALVEAEAGTEDLHGKLLVANVVLNRVESSIFPNDVSSVIYDPGQFDPARYIKYVEPSHDAKEAVMKALSGVDESGGALYFQRSKATEWGDKKYLFRYGEHSFYK